jgi:hypothetical protein
MYGGTQTSMLQLAKDVGVVDESMQSFGDMTFEQTIESIHKLQEQLGITGNAQEEASKTIQGTMAMTKAAWENLLIALANPEEDITEPIQNLITAIVGENEGEGLINQILPAVESALMGIGQLIEQLVPELLDRLPQFLDENLPMLIDSVVAILESVVQALITNADKIGEFITTLVTKSVTYIVENLPKIVQAGMTILTTLLTGLAKAMPELIPAIIECIRLIVDTLTDPKTLGDIIIAALDIIIAITEGIIGNIDKIIDAVFTVVDNLVQTLLRPDVLTKIINASIKTALAIGKGLLKAAPQILICLGKVLMSMANTITHTDWGSIGKNIIDGLLNGLKSAWNSITSWWNNGIGSMVSHVEKLLQIGSPSKVFKKIGGYTALGFGEGWKDEIGDIKDDMERDLDFDNNITTVPSNNTQSQTMSKNGAWTVMLNIDTFINNTDSDIETLADRLMEVISDKTRRTGVVYA